MPPISPNSILCTVEFSSLDCVGLSSKLSGKLSCDWPPGSQTLTLGKTIYFCEGHMLENSLLVFECSNEESKNGRKENVASCPHAGFSNKTRFTAHRKTKILYPRRSAMSFCSSPASSWAVVLQGISSATWRFYATPRFSYLPSSAFDTFKSPRECGWVFCTPCIHAEALVLLLHMLFFEFSVAISLLCALSVA